MTLDQFQKALSELPEKWKSVPFIEFRSMQYRDILVIAHPDHEPLQYFGGRWKPVLMVHEEAGHA